MKIKRLELGFFRVNCYILTINKKTIIIDPGADFKIIDRYLVEENIAPQFILNTHGHYDHMGAVLELKSKYKIPFFIHKLEESIIKNPDKNLSLFFGENGLSFDTYNLIEEGHSKNFEGLNIEIINTPGHTPGSIIIKYDNLLLTGDLLFRGGVGRTDLPGGNIKKIKQSLRMLKKMDKKLIVYPGHGESSCLDYEFKTNYYLKDDFLNE